MELRRQARYDKNINIYNAYNAGDRRFGIGNERYSVDRQGGKTQRFGGFQGQTRIGLFAEDLHKQPQSRRMLNYGDKQPHQPANFFTNEYRQTDRKWTPKTDPVQEHYRKLGEYYNKKYGV